MVFFRATYESMYSYRLPGSVRCVRRAATANWWSAYRGEVELYGSRSARTRDPDDHHTRPVGPGCYANDILGSDSPIVGPPGEIESAAICRDTRACPSAGDTIGREKNSRETVCTRVRRAQHHGTYCRAAFGDRTPARTPPPPQPPPPVHLPPSPPQTVCPSTARAVTVTAFTDAAVELRTDVTISAAG